VKNLEEYVPRDEQDLLSQVDLLVQAHCQSGDLYELDSDYYQASESFL